MIDDIGPILGPLGWIERVVTAHIQDQIVVSLVQSGVGNISRDQVNLQPSLSGFPACLADGLGNKIDPGDLPPLLAQGEEIGACAAAEVQRPSGGMAFQERVQFWRGNSTIPGGSFEIQQAEEQPFAKLLDPLEHDGILPDAAMDGRTLCKSLTASPSPLTRLTL